MSRATASVNYKGQVCVGLLTTQGPGCSETLTISASGLTIRSRLGNFTFDRDNIIRLGRAGVLPWLWTGVRIRHRVSGYPRHIGFWPRHISTGGLLRELSRRGFNVA